jgi:hypothetical protein
MSDDPTTFLGLTKLQFIASIVTVLVLITFADAYLTLRGVNLAQQGAETHSALCVLKRDYSQRESAAAAYLKLTPKQRARRYGTAIAEIPDATLRSQLVGLRSNVAALDSLHCG